MDTNTARRLPAGTPVIHSILGPATWRYKSSIDGPTAAWVQRDGETTLTLVDFTQVEPAQQSA